MNDQIAERLCVALEAIALELAESNAKGISLPPMASVAAMRPQAVPQQAAPAVVPAGVSAYFPPMEWVCPEHGTNRTVPAGIAKGTGKPYSAFLACGEYGCRNKPSFAPAAPARAVPPSQGVQGAVLP